MVLDGDVEAGLELAIAAGVTAGLLNLQSQPNPVREPAKSSGTHQGYGTDAAMTQQTRRTAALHDGLLRPCTGI